MSGKLGEILIRAQLITPQQLKDVLDYQRLNGGKLGNNLVRLGIVTDDQITAVLSRQYGVPAVDLARVELDQQVVRLVPREVAIKHSVLPVSRQEMTLRLAMSDPTNFYAMDDIKFITGFNIEPVVASEMSILRAIEQAYSGAKGSNWRRPEGLSLPCCHQAGWPELAASLAARRRNLMTARRR